jgi:hypothetical protein
MLAVLHVVSSWVRPRAGLAVLEMNKVQYLASAGAWTPELPASNLVAVLTAPVTADSE